MPKVTVYPTHENSAAVVHPDSGPVSDEGSSWEYDAFTAKMLADNAVTLEKSAGHKFAAVKQDASKPPAHATGSGVVVESEGVLKSDPAVMALVEEYDNASSPKKNK